MKYIFNSILGIIYLGAVVYLAVFLYKSPIWLTIYIILNVLAIVFYLYIKSDYLKFNSTLENKLEFLYYANLIGLIFPIPFWFLSVNHFIIRHKLLNKPVFSKTGEKMFKVNRNENHRFLNKGQQLEQELESYNFNVWITKDMAETQIIPIQSFSSHYQHCEKCNFKTFYQVYDKEIKLATYSNIGEGEIKCECKFCGHTTIETYVLSVLRYDDSDSGSSSSGSGSSSNGGGGSSWGGGGSSGGGSSSGY